MVVSMAKTCAPGPQWDLPGIQTSVIVEIFDLVVEIPQPGGTAKHLSLYQPHKLIDAFGISARGRLPSFIQKLFLQERKIVDQVRCLDPLPQFGVIFGRRLSGSYNQCGDPPDQKERSLDQEGIDPQLVGYSSEPNCQPCREE